MPLTSHAAAKYYRWFELLTNKQQTNKQHTNTSCAVKHQQCTRAKKRAVNAAFPKWPVLFGFEHGSYETSKA